MVSVATCRTMPLLVSHVTTVPPTPGFRNPPGKLESMADIYPPEMDTPLGQVRALIADTSQWDYDESGTARYRVTDSDIKAFIAIAGDGRIYGAAANALRAIAINEALISKVIRTEDLQTDGAKLATELRLQAKAMDDRQKDDDTTKAYEDSFVIVNFQYPYSNPEW